MLRFQETHLVFVYTIRSRHLTVLVLLLFAFGGSGRTFSRPLSALVLGRRLSECMSRRWQAKGWGDVDWVADGIGVSKKRWGMSLNFLAVAYTLYSRVITTFLFAKVASAGMTAKHRCPIFLDSLWQPSHFITKMGIPYTLPKNYLLFIPMALTAFLGKEKVYTRQDMGIKKSSHESYNRTKEKCLTTLRKSI